MIYERQSNRTRSSLMILSLNATLLIGVGLILPLTTVKAAAVTTTIGVQDKNGYVPRAKVTAFNERNGKQIANGLTDSGTGLLTFQCTKGTDLIVVVHTSTGYLGGARVTPGDFVTFVAIQPAGAMQIARFAPGFAPVPGMATTQTNSPETQSRTGVRSFYIDMPDLVGDSGDSSKANIVIVAWNTFEQIASGHTNKEGRFTFDIPEGMASAAFLTVRWTDNGEISLVAALPNNPSSNGPGSTEGFPSF